MHPRDGWRTGLRDGCRTPRRFPSGAVLLAVLGSMMVAVLHQHAMPLLFLRRSAGSGVARVTTPAPTIHPRLLLTRAPQPLSRDRAATAILRRTRTPPPTSPTGHTLGPGVGTGAGIAFAAAAVMWRRGMRRRVFPRPVGPLSGFAVLTTAGEGDTAPGFWQPVPREVDPSLPLLVFLPGIDGSGAAAQSQLVRLAQRFTVWALRIPLADRTPFAALVDLAVAFINQQAARTDATGPPRPVYVLGTSFGGALSLAVALRCRRVNRLIIVNPSTSFQRTVWPTAGPVLTRVPTPVYRLVGMLMGPVFANPFTAEAVGSDPSLVVPSGRAPAGPASAPRAAPRFRLVDALPRGTLQHKLELLLESSRLLHDDALRTITCRTLLFGGSLDLLLPSAAEVQRLARVLPLGRAVVVRGRSHTMLREAGVDLLRMVLDEGFYQQEQALSGVAGSPVTVDLPTPLEVERAGGPGFAALRTLFSPVFLSERPSGDVAEGLRPVDLGRRPIIIVCHDRPGLRPALALLLWHLLVEHGVLVRCLLTAPLEAARRPPRRDFASSVLRTCAPAPATLPTLEALLANREVVLWAPGDTSPTDVPGTAEGRGAAPREGGKLSQADVLAAAARYGATVIPLATVGVDTGALGRGLLFVVDRLLRRGPGAELPARSGPGNRFISAVLPTLKRGQRFYFLFGKPVPLTEADRTPTALVNEVIQGRIVSGTRWLEQQRERDPYVRIGPRIAYEATWGTSAPTFPLNDFGGSTHSRIYAQEPPPEPATPNAAAVAAAARVPAGPRGPRAPVFVVIASWLRRSDRKV